MIEITFEDFHEHNFDEEGFVLYVLKNGLDDALYVGISRNNIWSRWFAFGGHMIWDGKYIIGQSAVGKKILWNLFVSMFAAVKPVFICPSNLHFVSQTVRDCAARSPSPICAIKPLNTFNPRSI